MKLVDGNGDEIRLYPTDFFYLHDDLERKWLVATVTNDGDLMLHLPPLVLTWPDKSEHHNGPAPDRPAEVRAFEAALLASLEDDAPARPL